MFDFKDLRKEKCDFLSHFRGRWNSDNKVYRFWTTQYFNVPMDKVILEKVYNNGPSAASSLLITIINFIISIPSSSQLSDWIKLTPWGGVSVFGHQNQTGLPQMTHVQGQQVFTKTPFPGRDSRAGTWRVHWTLMLKMSDCFSCGWR